MSDGHGGGGHAEIVIIHRGHDAHDDHHGGAWKIAFADFMTAMMAFFLVMWLVSANDKTKASVARYFNPVKLVDATTQPRGLSDPKKDDSGLNTSPDTKTLKVDKDTKALSPPSKGPPPPETVNGKEKRLDAELQDNPYVALAEIVGDKGPGEQMSKDPASPQPGIGHSGAAFRDPFAPPPPGAADIDDETTPSDLPPMTTAKLEDQAKDPVKTQVAVAATGPAKSDATTVNDAAKKEALAQKQTAALKATLVAAMKSLGPDMTGPAFDVRKTEEGTLFSLTDTANFTMFSNGSAVPDKRVILMMEKIAELVKTKPGKIVIRGFTDNKKFKTGRYDNWHLSLDRAQIAHYMLVRGGLTDERIAHVEGYADHEIRQGIEAADPRNRRIELLLKDDPK